MLSFQPERRLFPKKLSFISLNNLTSPGNTQLPWIWHSYLASKLMLRNHSIAESTRRTILMTYLIRGLYSFCKLGRCDADAYTHATAMCRLQFTAEALLWDSPSVDDPSQCSQGLISYGELDRGVRRSLYMPAFEKLLLVACKGQECSELIVSGWMEAVVSLLVFDFCLLLVSWIVAGWWVVIDDPD